MDAQSHLISQGWSGPGTSLDPTGRGLKRPLLVSRKTANTGIGLTGWNAHVGGGAWWDNIWEKGAKGDDGRDPTDEALGSGKLWGIKRGGGVGLYGRFRKGQGLGGTIGLVVEEGEGKEQRKRERAARQAAREEKRRRREERRLEKISQAPLLMVSPPASDDGLKKSTKTPRGESAKQKPSTMRAIHEDAVQLPTPEEELSESEGQAKRRRRAGRKAKRAANDAEKGARVEVKTTEEAEEDETMEDVAPDTRDNHTQEHIVLGSSTAERRKRKEERRQRRARKEERWRLKDERERTTG